MEFGIDGKSDELGSHASYSTLYLVTILRFFSRCTGQISLQFFFKVYKVSFKYISWSIRDHFSIIPDSIYPFDSFAVSFNRPYVQFNQRSFLSVIYHLCFFLDCPEFLLELRLDLGGNYIWKILYRVYKTLVTVLESAKNYILTKISTYSVSVPCWSYYKPLHILPIKKIQYRDQPGTQIQFKLITWDGTLEDQICNRTGRGVGRIKIKDRRSGIQMGRSVKLCQIRQGSGMVLARAWNGVSMQF